MRNERVQGRRMAWGLAGLACAYHLFSEMRADLGGPPSIPQRLEGMALDAKLSARGARPPDRWGVVIAGVDEKSLERFGPLPWDRRRHAQLVEGLHALGASSIAFDMTFEQAGRWDPELRRALSLAAPCLESSSSSVATSLRAKVSSGDAEFARAMRESGRVVLGVVARTKDEADALGAQSDWPPEIASSLVDGLVISSEQGVDRIRPAAGAFRDGAYRRYFGLGLPAATLAAAASGLGALNAAPDGDGVHRSFPLLVAFSGRDVLLPSLAVKAVAVARDTTVDVLGDPEAVIADGLRLGGPPLPMQVGGRVTLDWYGRATGIPQLSIADVLEGQVPRTAVEGKVVFVAATAVGTHDQRVTPLDPAVPGVVIHATLAQNLLDAQYLRRPAYLLALELLVMGLAGWFLGSRRIGAVVRVMLGLGLAAGWLVFDLAFLFERGWVSHGLVLLLQIFVTVLVLSLFGFIAEARERRATREAFGRYLSPRVLEKVLSDPNRHLRLGGERYQATVLFSDIRGFTSISERLEPEQLGTLLNRYMTPMTRTVFAHEGTLDKYIGDAVMAFWGAPIPQPDHALRACRAAIDMRQRLEELNAELENQGFPALAIGVGISSGAMTVGNMGSDDFFAYTALGDRVNLGARLEGQTKSYGIDIIISEATYEAVKDEMLCRELDLLRVRGKREPERIYELIGERRRCGDRILFVETFGLGLAAFRERRFDEASVYFDEAWGMQPEDICSEQYRDLSAYLAVHPPPPNWDGVREATAK